MDKGLFNVDKLIDYEEVARIAHEHHLTEEEIREFIKGLQPTIVSRSEFTDRILEEFGMEGQFISSRDYMNYVTNKNQNSNNSSKELNEKDLENVLGGAHPMAVSEKISEGYTKTFRDKVLEDRFKSNINPETSNARVGEDYKETFRDKVLEAGLANTKKEDEGYKR